MARFNYFFSSIVATLLLLAITTGQSYAADSMSNSTASSGAASTDPLSFRLDVYGWATALKGTAGIRGLDADVDLSIKDVLEDLDGAAMATFEVKYGRISLMNDLVYAKLSDSTPSPHDIIFSNANYEIKQTLWTQAVGYRVIDDECYSLDILGGFRLASVDQDLSIDGNTLSDGTEVQDRGRSREDTWIDPIVGLRGQARLGDNFFLRAMGDIGGFNASSALTWQALGLIGYEVCDYASLGIGYRGIGYDHNRDGFKYNMDLHGPIFGVEMKF